MKAVKVVFGALAGLYSIAQVFQVIYLLTADTGNEYQSSRLLSAISLVCIAAVISAVLFRSAFKTCGEDFEDDEYDEDEDHEDEIEYEERGGNYFSMHWYGELSLNVSFWVNVIGLNIALVLFNKIITSKFFITNPVTIGRMFVITMPLIFFVIYPWQIVGLWRSCNRHKLVTGSCRCGRLVQLLIILGLIALPIQLKVLLPAYKVYSKIGFTKDPLDNCVLELKKDNTIIHLQGTLGFGVSKRVAKLLKKHPEIDSVILDSGGGRIYEGRQIGKLIRKYRLNTYSLTECCSAASIAFICGQRRYLSGSAVMGYHQYRMGFAGLEPFTDLAKEQNADLGLFRKQGVKEDFLDKLFNASHDDLWFPSHDEMLSAGVIDEVINPVDLLGDEYKFDIDEFEQGLLEVNLYKVIKKYDPESYDEILQAFSEQIENGASMQQIQLAGAALIETMAVKLMPVTSDEALIGYIKSIVKILKRAVEVEPEMGMKLLFPQVYGIADLSGHFTFKEQMVLPETLEKIVLDAYEKENPEVDIEAARLKLESIQFEIQDAAQYLDPTNIKGKEDYKKCCEAMIRFYELILAEDEKTSANVLRCIFNQVQ